MNMKLIALAGSLCTLTALAVQKPFAKKGKDESSKVADFFKNNPRGKVIFLALKATSPGITVQKAAQILKNNIIL